MAAAKFFNVPEKTETGFYCRICDATVDTEQIWESHISGKRHIKNMRKPENALKIHRTERVPRHVPRHDFVPKRNYVLGDECFPRHEYGPRNEHQYMPEHDYKLGDEYVPNHDYRPRVEYVPEAKIIPRDDPISFPPRTFYYCEVCDSRLYTEHNIKAHLNGRRHAMNLRSPGSGDRAYVSNQFAVRKVPNDDLYCEVCDCRMDTVYMWDNHVAGKRHEMNLYNSNKHKYDAYHWSRSKEGEHSREQEAQSSKSSYFKAFSSETHFLQTVPTTNAGSASSSKLHKASAAIKDHASPSTSKSVIAPPNFRSFAPTHSNAHPSTSQSNVAPPSSGPSTALKSGNSTVPRSEAAATINSEFIPLINSGSSAAPSNSISKTAAPALDAPCTSSSATHHANQASPLVLPEASSSADRYPPANSILSAEQISMPRGIEDVDLLRDVQMCSTELQMELLELLLVDDPPPLETEEDIQVASEILNKAKQVLLKWHVDRLPLKEQQRFVNAIELQEEDPVYKEVFGPVGKKYLD